MTDNGTIRAARNGALLVVFGSILFGTLGTLSVLAYERGMTPVAYGAWRETIGVIGLLILLATGIGRPARGSFSVRTLPARQKGRLLVATVAFMTFSLAMFYAFSYITVALALLLFYTYPAIVTVVGGITGKERITASKIVALCMALGGSVLAVMGGYFGAGGVEINMVGVALACLAAVADTVYFVVGRDGYPDVPPIYATLFFLIAGALVFASIAAASGGLGDIGHPFTEAGLWPILLFAGIFGAAIPTIMILNGIRMIGSSRASIMALVEPISGVVIAAGVLSQGMLPVQIVGGVLVLVGVVLLQRSKDEPAEASVAAVPEPAGQAV